MSITKEQYQNYLHSEDWKKKANERMKIDGFTCQSCGTRGTPSNPLCVHHFSYRNLPFEDVNKDLVTVCKCCHSNLHNVMNRITNPNTGRRGWRDDVEISTITTSYNVYEN